MSHGNVRLDLKDLYLKRLFILRRHANLKTCALCLRRDFIKLNVRLDLKDNYLKCLNEIRCCIMFRERLH